MTIIGGKQHPKHPEWIWMMCDECFQNYWTNFAPNREEKKHYCSGCRTASRPPARGPGRSADRDYHGGQFTSGEW